MLSLYQGFYCKIGAGLQLRFANITLVCFKDAEQLFRLMLQVLTSWRLDAYSNTSLPRTGKVGMKWTRSTTLRYPVQPAVAVGQLGLKFGQNLRSRC